MSHGGIPSDTERHDDCALRSRHAGEGLGGFESGRQVEAMSAVEAEIVHKDMTIQLFSELGAEYASTYATDKTA
jgi:truncated hemoglobin YjbI